MVINMDHEYYMREALASARKAASEGETPVGAVIVKDGKIIGRGRNATERRDATCHAEIEAIREAAKNAGDWRLDGASIYVTMEPCPMCAGAIMNSRISSVFFGARDKNMGSCGSVINLFMENYGRKAEITGGVLEEDCAAVLSDFFKNVR